MKIPFIREVPKFEPRKKPWLSKDLDVNQREMLDVIDVLDQKVDYSVDAAVAANNAVVYLALVLVLTQGPAVLNLIQGWFGPEQESRHRIVQHEPRSTTQASNVNPEKQNAH